MRDFQEFQFILLKIRDCDRTSENLVNQAYFFWRTFWSKELSKFTNNVPKWADEFYRHDYVGLITYHGQPVALHLYGFQGLGLSACRGQSYFESYSEDFITRVRRDGYHRVISTSWLAVNPTYQRLDDRILFSKCMLVLAQHVCRHFNYDANIATTRMDNGIAAKIIDWGGRSYGEKLHNDVQCALLLITPDVRVPISEYEQSFLNHIWKVDQLTTEITKIAA